MQDRAIAPFAPTERPGAARLNMIRDIALSVGTISGGGATEVMQLPHGTSVFTPSASPSQRPVKVRVNTTIAAGRYNAKRYSGSGAYLASGSFTAAERGTVAASDDCIVIDPEQDGVSDANALPLIGLETYGWVVGTDSATGKPEIEIPPPGVRAMQYNTTTHKLQVAYVSNPNSDQWVDMVTATPCP